MGRRSAGLKLRHRCTYRKPLGELPSLLEIVFQGVAVGKREDPFETCGAKKKREKIRTFIGKRITQKRGQDGQEGLLKSQDHTKLETMRVG